MKVVLATSLLAMVLSIAPGYAISPQQAKALPGRFQTPKVPSLNHVYIVLDQATFDAIRDSRELARILGRTDAGLPDYAPPRPDADRVFFRGRHTYLELFAPKNRFNEPVGKVGIALGHDTPSRFETLATAWKNLCGSRFRRSPAVYSRHQPPVPWYDAVQCDDTAGSPHLAIWGMVYRPEFHRWQIGQTGVSRARTARADILTPRRADGQGHFDITALSLDVNHELYPALHQQLAHAGMIWKRGHFVGDGWKFGLRAARRTRLSSIAMATTATLSRKERLGSALLMRSAVRLTPARLELHFDR